MSNSTHALIVFASHAQVHQLSSNYKQQSFSGDPTLYSPLIIDIMGDWNIHNEVGSEGVQGAIFFSSQVQNPVINIHSPGRREFSENYQRIRIIGRGTFGNNVWKVKPKHVTSSEEFVMKEVICRDQDVSAGKDEIEILKQCSHENIVQ